MKSLLPFHLTLYIFLGRFHPLPWLTIISMLPTPKFIIPILNFFLSSAYVMQTTHWIASQIWTSNSTYLKANSSSFSSSLLSPLVFPMSANITLMSTPNSYLNFMLLKCLLWLVSCICFWVSFFCCSLDQLLQYLLCGFFR